MSPVDPALIMFALVAGGLGAYLLAAPRRLFPLSEEPARYRPGAIERDSEHGRWLRFGFGPQLIGAALGCAAIAVFAAAGRVEGRIVIGTAIAVLPLVIALTMPAARPRSMAEWGRLALGSGSAGLLFYVFTGFGESTAVFRAREFAELILGVLAAGLLLRRLIRHWNDEAWLAEHFDDGQGYIERPRRLSLRTRLALEAGFILLFGVLAAAVFVYNRFAPG